MSPDLRDAISAYVASTILFAIMFAAGKLLATHLSVVEIVFYRNFLSFLPLLIVLVFKRDWILLNVRQPRLLLLRCLIGTIGMALTFTAYKVLPLPTVTTILFTATLWLIPLSILFLGEKIDRTRLLAAVIGFIGVLVMAHPSQTGGTFLALLIALLAAFFHAAIGIMLRQLGRTENPLTIALSFLGLGAIFSGAVMPFTTSGVNISDLPLLAVLGISGALGQYLLSMAYKKAEASTLGPLNYLNLIWASLFGFFIWGDIMDLNGWIGAAIIIGSNFYILLHQRKKPSLPDANAP